MAACSGIRIVELSEGFGPAALCGQLFAGLGADVVKIESPSGDVLRKSGHPASDGMPHLFHLLHDRKRIVSLSGEDDADRWVDLVESADVIILQERLPAALGKDHDDFCRRWPAKVLCSVTPFGVKSAYAAWKGDELVVEAMSGLLSCNGYPERPPVCSGLPYLTHIAALFAFNGILAALLESDRSGKGQWLDLSVVDGAIALLGNFLPAYFLSGRSPKRIGNRHTIAAPWNLYPASDGQLVICTGTGGLHWWKKMLEVIDRPDLVGDPRYETEADRVRNVEGVDTIMTAWTHTRSMAEIVGRMTAAGIPAGEINAIARVLGDPHYRDVRALVVPSRSDEPAGSSWPLLGLPLKIGDWVPSEQGFATPDQNAEARPAWNGPVRDGQKQHDRAALRGLRVLEFASRTSVPMAGRIMSDLGADVVKIEPGKGDALRGAGQPVGGISYLFQINNAGKRSVVLDPASADGRQAILDLVAEADVWMENLAPGTLERMGLGYEVLSAVNPRLIYCSVSGFGVKSNYGNRKALDTVVQAACGLMDMTGYPDHLPVKLGISAIDLSSAVGLLGAIFAGLRLRQQTGKGTFVDIAMADMGVWMTQSFWPELYFGSGHPKRMGNRSPDAAPHDLYAAKDGLVAISVGADAEWQKLAALIGDEALRDPSLATTKGRLANVDPIDRAISEWVAGRESMAVAETCQANGIAAAPVRELAQVAEDPDVVGRRMIISVDHPSAGRLQLPGNPLAFSRTAPRTKSPAPVLGEHTDQVLGEWLGQKDRRRKQG